MSENKEAVEAVAQALAEVDGHNWTNPGCENKEDDKALRKHYRIVARIAVNIASSHILEEAARIAERAHIDPTEEDDGNILRRTTNVAAAAAIRAAKETDE